MQRRALASVGRLQSSELFRSGTGASVSSECPACGSDLLSVLLRDARQLFGSSFGSQFSRRAREENNHGADLFQDPSIAYRCVSQQSVLGYHFSPRCLSSESSSLNAHNSKELKKDVILIASLTSGNSPSMSVRHLASLDWSTLSSFTTPFHQSLRSQGYLPRSRSSITASNERCATFDGNSFCQAKPFTTSTEPQQSGGWLDHLWNGPAGPEPPAVTRYDPSAQEQGAEGRRDVGQVSSAPDALSPKYSRPRREDMERRRRRRKEETDDLKARASAAKVGEKRKRFKAYAAAGGGTAMQWEWEDAVVREGLKGGSEREPGPINSPPGDTNSASWVVRKMPRDHREHLRDLAAMQRRRRTSDRKRSGLGVTRKELAEFEESLSRRPFQILGEPKPRTHQGEGEGDGPPAGKAHVLGWKDHALEVERVPPAAWFVVRKLQRAGESASVRRASVGVVLFLQIVILLFSSCFWYATSSQLA
jgi:hypothetical protein